MTPGESTGSSPSSTLPSEAADRLAQIAGAQSERPWRYYTPVPRVLNGFHRSLAAYRLLHGPNGGGKTWAGACELACYLTGYNHFRNERYPVPNRCWAVALDRVNQQPVMFRTLQSMLPKGTRWREKEQKFVLPAPWGSECYMRVCEPGDPNKFTGERILAAWFDEEWPGESGLAIWKETMRRTQPGWPLRIFMTVTPTQGYTWTYDHLYKPGPKRFPGAQAFNFTLYDCAREKGGFLTEDEIKDAESKCQTPADFAIRIRGEYYLVGSNPAFPAEQLMAALERAAPGDRFRLGTKTLNGIVLPTLERHEDGELVILVRPQRGRQYILGADPSMGVGRDRAVASIIDRRLPVECAYFASNLMPPVRFARDVIAPLAWLYNDALAAVESNSEAGGACLAVLPTYYSNLYMEQDFIRIPGQHGGQFKRRYGYRTDTHSRGLVWGVYKDLLPMKDFVVSDDLVHELMELVSTDGRIDHQDGKNDDHAFAFGIGAAVNRLNPPVTYEPWEDYRQTYKGPNAWMGS